MMLVWCGGQAETGQACNDPTYCTLLHRDPLPIMTRHSIVVILMILNAIDGSRTRRSTPSFTRPPLKEDEEEEEEKEEGVGIIRGTLFIHPLLMFPPPHNMSTT